MRKWVGLLLALGMCGDAWGGEPRGEYPVYGRSVEIDPHFGRYYKDRSPASIASEIQVNGYTVVRYIVTADSAIDRALIEAFHTAGMGVWYATFGNGTYSRQDLPAGWEAWRMVTRGDLEGKPPADGFTRLCLNNAAYRAWKKGRIAETLRTFPFDGIDIMEPHWPEYPGQKSPTYACFCEACRACFQKMFPGRHGLPDILLPESPRSPAADPGLWQDWLAFRQASLTDFLNDLVNGPGGIRASAPAVRVCTWTLALSGPEGLRRVREDSGEDAGRIARVVRPNLHCFQTHWPDWLRPDLPADYANHYRPFVDQVRKAAPALPLMIQADIGSRPENRRSWSWIRAFERSCEAMGAGSTTFYEYALGDYIYSDPPRIAEIRTRTVAADLHFTRRLDPVWARDLARYAASPGRVTGVRVDGNTATLAIEGVKPGEPCTLTVHDLRDDPERRLFKDRSAAVLESQTERFRMGSSATGREQRQVAGRIIEARDVAAFQREVADPAAGRYDWGPSVMYDGTFYRMWWTRLGGSDQKRFPYAATLPDGERFEFTYPDRGDRIYYAESRDGAVWRLDGLDSPGSLMVLGPAESGQERMHVGCPSAIHVDNTYYLYYEASCEFKVFRGPGGAIRVGDEYHAQVFLATSKDGRTWHRYPSDVHPEPIVPAPEENKQFGRQRYGMGQPSVFYRDGRFVMHYVDSCTGPGDFIVRVEADNPYFRNARVFGRALRPAGGTGHIPRGAVARFAQADVKYLDDTYYLLRPAYGTGRLGLLTSRTGLFEIDADAGLPQAIYPQLNVPDPRGPDHRERLYPDFLTDPHGRILVQDGHVTLYYSAGRGFKEAAFTWDIHRARIDLKELAVCMSQPAP